MATGVRGLLIDDIHCRTVAALVGLEPHGTLGILEAAARLDQVDSRECLDSLLLTNFRISRKVRWEYHQIAKDISADR